MALELQPGPRGAVRIDGFSGARFRVLGETRPGAIRIWTGGVDDVAEVLTPEAFQPLLEVDPPIDVILVGTGRSMLWPDAALMETLRARGVGIDVMTSRLAARTYNVLVGEGRQVGALLLSLEA